MKIIIISGPTASGKSAAALEFACKRNATIINADAMQLYAGLPILSSQPKDLECGFYRLYSILDPFDLSINSSVASWLKLVLAAIKTSLAENKIPVLVGGTGMYLSRLIYGITEIPTISEETKTRAQLLYSELGVDKFREQLIGLGEDESVVKTLDHHRLLRNYQVLLETGKSIFWWHQNQSNSGLDPAAFIHLNLEPDRAQLYETCNLRLEQMFKDGVVAEVKKLLDFGLGTELTLAIRNTIGFTEIENFLAGKISQAEAAETIAKKTRNYAKRQLTWFRNQFHSKLIFSNSFELAKYLKDLQLSKL